MSRILGRNEPCICGSNKKFKKCCLNKPGFNIEEHKDEILKRNQGPSKSSAAKEVTLPSGLKLTDHVHGSGGEAVAGNTVTVHYTGWLFDSEAEGNKGAKFDSSVDRGTPFEFQLGAGMVIAGWDQGFAGMKIGGKRTLVIPSEMGYGERGAGGSIPPNATLVFDVELFGVK